MDEAKKHFKPEFLNRLDDLVVFKMLEKESLSAIVDLEIDKLLERLREKEIELELDSSARDFLITEGYDPNFGARPMRRAVERHLEDPLAEALLRGDFKLGDLVAVSHEEKAKVLSFEAKPSKSEPDEAGASGRIDRAGPGSAPGTPRAACSSFVAVGSSAAGSSTTGTVTLSW